VVGDRLARECPARPVPGSERGARARSRFRGFGPAVLGACALLATPIFTATAQAQSSAYGELTRFGEAGSGPGQISGEERARSGGEPRAHLLGVDPTDNSVYVLDEPRELEQKRKKPTPEEEAECVEEEIPPQECGPPTGPVKRHLRLQKFAAQAGVYHLVGAKEFEEEAPNGPFGNSQLNVEGIAVDAARKRVYILACDVREAKLKVDKEGQLGNLPVAATVFSFSTEQQEGKLVPAGRSGKEKEILTGAAELQAQSEAPGKALLEPAGITVDPEDGDIIVLGHEDPSGQAEDSLYDSREHTSPDHFALQRVSASGEPVAGEAGRYVDRTNFLKVSEFKPPPSPSSPVVVGAPGSEHVDLSYEGGIVRVPIEFASAGAPQFAYSPRASVSRGVAEGFIDLSSRLGGALSAGPFEGEDNTIYAATQEVENEQPGVGQALKGVLAFSAATTSILGWSGAQSLLAPRPEGEGHATCVLDPASAELSNLVAAGSGDHVFVLALEFIDLKEGERLYEGPAFPAIVELGAGGTGCPVANGGGLVAEVNGEVLGGHSVTAGEPVTLSSFVSQADALKVEWNFGDGITETVSTQFHCPASAPAEYRENVRQCPSVQHTFAQSGNLTVTETVYTDDLSTPTVTQRTTVTVSGGGQGPTAVLTGPLEATRGQPALFDGSFSTDPAGPNQITEYHWDFGDGLGETSTSPTVAHTYTRAGAYKVALAVTDAAGLNSVPAALPRPVLVVEPRAELQGLAQTQSSNPAATGGGGVSASQSTFPPVPRVTVASAALAVTRGRFVELTLYCPAEETSCAGRLMLSARVPSGGRRRAKHRASPLTLASGSFSLAGGQRKRIALPLSARALALLTGVRSLVAQLAIDAHDPSGARHVSQLPVVIRAPSRQGAAKHGRR
jgi:PKD repeat protein